MFPTSRIRLVLSINVHKLYALCSYKFFSLSCTHHACIRVRRSFFVWIIFFILHADTAFCCSDYIRCAPPDAHKRNVLSYGEKFFHSCSFTLASRSVFCGSSFLHKSFLYFYTQTLRVVVPIRSNAC